MPPVHIPPELKKITQYVRRAEELQGQASPKTTIMAYHCFQYACQVGIPLASTPAAKQCIGSILDILEKDRPKMENFTLDEKYQLCREFATSVFDKADTEDRSGNSNKNTAKTFYASATFLDVLRQFHKEDEEETDEIVEEGKMSFYAKWKATEILKAIKEGGEIKPGGYGTDLVQDDGDDDDNDDGVGDNDDGNHQESNENVNDQDDTIIPQTQEHEKEDPSSLLPPPPAYHEHFTPIAPPLEDDTSDIFSIPATPKQSLPLPETDHKRGMMQSVSTFLGITPKKYDAATYQDARELTLFALKALEDKDGETAVQRLKEALEIMST
jgi:vacuolar protein sorting-associated protein VTA1